MYEDETNECYTASNTSGFAWPNSKSQSFMFIWNPRLKPIYDQIILAVVSR